jgi:FkbM family methyltransferase
MQFLQKLLLGIYSFFKKIGLIDNPFFKRIFIAAYFLYKQILEDPFFDLTRKKSSFFKGGYILDIGANIGYTSIVFSNVLTPGFKIFAFEPDISNFESLKETTRNYHVVDKVIPICAAVGSVDGCADLWHNQQHHADHRIVTKQYRNTIVDPVQISTVKMYTVDSFCQENKIESKIGFVKIDVQGYELPVCIGMQSTLNANPNMIIALEYMPSSMSELGFNPESILQFFKDRDYFIYVLLRGGKLEPISLNNINSTILRRGYIDLICSKKKLM